MYRQRFTTQKEPGSTGGKPAVEWRVPAIAVLMLLIGLSIGYLSRPTIEARFFTPPTSTSTVTETDDSLEALRVEVQAQTRHYLGNEDAQVTLIEFGDFQ